MQEAKVYHLVKDEVKVGRQRKGLRSGLTESGRHCICKNGEAEEDVIY